MLDIALNVGDCRITGFPEFAKFFFFGGLCLSQQSSDTPQYPPGLRN